MCMLKMQVDPKSIFEQTGMHLTQRPHCLCKGTAVSSLISHQSSTMVTGQHHVEVLV